VGLSSELGLAQVVSDLRGERDRWRASVHRSRDLAGRELPSREAISTIIDALRRALFPMRLGPPDLLQDQEDRFVEQTLEGALGALRDQIVLELRYVARQRGANGVEAEGDALGVVKTLAAALPRIRRLLDTDVRAAFLGDPAARSVDEILLCYPGIEALTHHRIAHELYRLGAPLVARIIGEKAHGQTGIDIHPGAAIGESFFIDHGTGVVIGETAIIGARVRLYQAVTLGAKRFPVDENGVPQKGLPRHPIIEDDVVVYSGATILGRITVGRGSTIGGNVWLTHSVPPGTHLTQTDRRRRTPRSGSKDFADALPQEGS
jgi:serine O-acetyltransferase